MAATSAALRSSVDAISAAALRDLAALLDRLGRDADAEAIRNLLDVVLPPLVEQYAIAAGVLAADWYDVLRADLGVPGAFTATPAAVGDLGVDALVGWGVSPLFDAEPDYAAARTLIAGGVQRRIANAARETVTTSSVDDPNARGWQRTGSGSCAFCRMLIGRGNVYTEKSADFASHDHCHCAAVPWFENQPRPVKSFTPSDRNTTSADRARARQWLRDNS